MENEKILVLRLELTQKRCLFALTLAFLCFQPRPLGSETQTLTTYYPAPYGGYVALLTTGGSATSPVDTLLARDAGRVGIGTIGTSPQAKLHVSGKIRMDDETANSDAGNVVATKSYVDAKEVDSEIVLEEAPKTPKFKPTSYTIRYSKYGSGAECSAGYVISGCTASCRGSVGDWDLHPFKHGCKLDPNSQCKGSAPQFKVRAVCVRITPSGS